MNHTIYFQWDDRTPLIHSILRASSTIRSRVERELLPKVIKESVLFYDLCQYLGKTPQGISSYFQLVSKVSPEVSFSWVLEGERIFLKVFSPHFSHLIYDLKGFNPLSEDDVEFLDIEYLFQSYKTQVMTLEAVPHAIGEFWIDWERYYEDCKESSDEYIPLHLRQDLNFNTLIPSVSERQEDLLKKILPRKESFDLAFGKNSQELENTYGTLEQVVNDLIQKSLKKDLTAKDLLGHDDLDSLQTLKR